MYGMGILPLAISGDTLMSYYLDMDAAVPTLYYTTKNEVYRLPKYIKNMTQVDHVPSGAVQLTDKNLLAQFMIITHRSKESSQ